MAESKDAIQIFMHRLETITSTYGLTISTTKTKTMAFNVKYPVRSKIIINNNSIEKINTATVRDLKRYCCQNIKISLDNGKY